MNLIINIHSRWLDLLYIKLEILYMCHNLSAPAITSDKIKLAKEELARDLSTSIT